MEKKTYDEKTIRNRILGMIVPITAENILQMTAGVVSMAMVGRISPLAVGAIGMSNILFRIIWSIFRGIGTGASVFVAQSYGADNHKKIRSTTVQSFFLVFIFSIVLQQFLYWNADTLIRVFNPTSDLLVDGVMYVRIISWSLPFAAIILASAGIQQGLGDARTPMMIIGILNIVNIIFCYLLIFGNLGLPQLGIRGAGYAYNISYIVAAVFAIFALFRSSGTFSRIKDSFEIKFNLKEAISIVKFGLPTSFETAFWQVSAIFITRAILQFGETAYAAYQLGLQAEAISFMPAAGFSVAASTFVGQAVGARDGELGKRYFSHLIKLSIMITSIASIALIFFPRLIMRGFTTDPDVIAIGALYLFVMGLVQIPQNLTSLTGGAIRGAGFAKIPMLISGIGLWLVRIPLIQLVAFVLELDILWIWIVMGIDLIFRFALAIFIYKRKDIFNNSRIITSQE